MITKALVCGFAFGCLAVFATMLDRGHQRALDSLVQLPFCSVSDSATQPSNAGGSPSTQRFFALLAAH